MPSSLSLHGTRKYLLFGGLFFGGTLLALGLLLKAWNSLPESSFTLASDSRLPRWIKLPPESSRTSVSVTMNYYLVPSTYVSFIMKDAKDHVVHKADGKQICASAFHMINHPQGPLFSSSTYVPITVDGMTEIIEHRKMEPTFYVTDDPKVWKQYEERGCG